VILLISVELFKLSIHNLIKDTNQCFCYRVSIEYLNIKNAHKILLTANYTNFSVTFKGKKKRRQSKQYLRGDNKTHQNLDKNGLPLRGGG